MNTIPNHIAIIMDGNRRWAREHHLPELEGHRQVADKILEPLIEHAASVGIKYITLWAWSTENWKRTVDEVSGIMKLLRWGFGAYGKRMHKKGIRITAIGDRTKFDPDIQKSMTDLIALTKDNTRITVIFALNYGGRDEIIRAVNTAFREKRYEMRDTRIAEEEFSQLLDTAGIPDPEFIIRTGGEKRLSGFLLWQSEYSELYFADWYMPEFTPKRLDEILEDFAGRQRRFGK